MFFFFFLNILNNFVIEKWTHQFAYYCGIDGTRPWRSRVRCIILSVKCESGSGLCTLLSATICSTSCWGCQYSALSATAESLEICSVCVIFIYFLKCQFNCATVFGVIQHMDISAIVMWWRYSHIKYISQHIPTRQSKVGDILFTID